MSENTPLPWTVHEHTHAYGDLWLSIGYVLPDGSSRGPVAEMSGEKTALFQPVCEFKYLATPDDQQRANAEYIVCACNLFPELVAALEAVIAWDDKGTPDINGLYEPMLQARTAITKARAES